MIRLLRFNLKNGRPKLSAEFKYSGCACKDLAKPYMIQDPHDNFLPVDLVDKGV